MEHAVHLASRHFVEGVSPSPAAAVLKKVRQAFNSASPDNVDDVDLDRLDAALTGFDEVSEGTESSGNNDEADDFDIGDTVGKALALVTQVCLYIL